MARPHIVAITRRFVIQRAEQRCEYCLLPAEWVSISHHIDHIIPLKHGGVTHVDNLAYACFDCNIAKGSDIATFDPLTREMSRLFHPRTDNWLAHFSLDNNRIIGLDVVGRATSQLLQFNEPSRVYQRKLLIAANVYGL
ncbi:HNH endonuclease [Chloroflexi bacterium TSY]|nr:HNH endonuclease [Chloroflexi bacterium TSY]